MELTDSNFQREVLESRLPVLVDFWAQWCAPCRYMAPMVDDLERAYAGRIRVGKLDADQNAMTVNGYGVTSLPTFLLFKDGRVIGTLVGGGPKDRLESFMRSALDG